MVRRLLSTPPGNGALPKLPAELRSRPDRAEDLPAWRRSRRQWEAEHGVTVGELWQAELTVARADGLALAAVNAPYTAGRCIEAEYDDPRWADADR